MTLHHAGVVIDPEDLVDHDGCTMLLYLCRASEGLNDDTVESLRVLLRFGVNVNATDNYGNTAIHIFFGAFWFEDRESLVAKKNFLTLLLQSVLKTGADLHVKNDFGIEASQVAYGHLEHDWPESLSQRTRIWNEVLTEIGLDIAEFQSCCTQCQCQNADLFNEDFFPGRKAFCDSYKKGAYLERHTLRPAVTEVLDSSDEESEAEPEDHHRPSAPDNTTTTTTTHQEPSNPAIPETRSKTFWDVI